MSASDKLHNARSTVRDQRLHGPALWERFSGTREQIIGNYAGLLAAYENGTPDARRDEIVLELRDAVAQMSL